MSKGDQTRERIVARAAPVFNQQGYAGASMADIMRATGLEKGGIYNHFASKDELALAAFDYAVGLISQRFEQALAGKRHAVERLHAITEVFSDTIINPPVPGGCPLMNTAIEADDTHPALRARACAAMDEWLGLVRRVVARGVERGELRPDADPEAVATHLTATLEGAIMISRLYGDQTYLRRTAAQVGWYIDTVLAHA